MKKFLAGLCDFLTAGPGRILLAFMAFSMVVWTLQCSLLQNVLGLDILEAVSWGETFTWGNFKHPPLSGWLAGLFSRLSGHQDWSLYLLAQCCLVTGVWFTYRTARLWFEEYRAATAALLLYFLHYYTPSWMKFSTYFAEMALAPVAVWCFFSALQRQRLRYWLLFGVLCALGLLNKYSFGLQILGMGIVLLSCREYRKALVRPGIWLAGILCCLLLIPHLRWLYEHDFICFTHISHRLEDEPDRFLTLEILGTAVYPFAAVAGAVLLARFLPPRLTPAPAAVPRNVPVLRWALILTLLPPVCYAALAFAGRDVILMWLCSTVSWCGAAVLAVIPFAIDRRIFLRLSGLLGIFILIMLIATTADLFFRSGFRLHTRPEKLVEAAEAVWRENASGPIPLLYGDRFYVCAVQNYSKERPPVCEAGDPVRTRECREIIRKKGMLVITSPREFRITNHALMQAGFPELPPQQECRLTVISFKAPLGKESRKMAYFLYYPPAERVKSEAVQALPQPRLTN